MPRNRVIYNSEALFAGQKIGDKCYTEDEGVNSIKQLHRVQNANYSFNISRTDVNQFGELAAIDRIITDTPTVALDFSYYLSNFANEEALGLNVAGDIATLGGGDPFGDGEGLTTALKFFLDGSKDQRNYFIQTSAEGTDANNDQDDRNKSIIGIGNGFLTSYSVEASVGGLPTVSVGVEGLNMAFENGNILKSSGNGTSDYVNSWKTTTGNCPVLYNSNKNRIDFITGITGDGVAYSGWHHATTTDIRGGAANRPTSTHSTLDWRKSGVPLPSINPVDGTKSQGVFFLPTVSGHAGADTSGILNLSTLRPGDVRLYFRQVEQGGQAALSGYTGSTDIEGLEAFKDPDIPGVGLPTQSGYKREVADSNDADGGVQAAHIQSFSLDFGLSRTPLQRLGVKHAFSREVDFPLTVSLSVDAILADLTTGNLADIIDCDRSYDIAVEMCAPADCTAGTVDHDLRGFDSRTPVATYIMKNAKLDSESFSSSIGDNKSVTLDFTAQIGGPNQSGNGLFMKGVTPSNIGAAQFATTDLPFPTDDSLLV